MRAYSKFAESYGSVQVVTGVATADNIQLIQMLFDGLLESLATASGHVQNLGSRWPHCGGLAGCAGF
jgi:flagellar protein FliS